MPDTEIAAISIGITELIKKLGLNRKFAPLIAIGLSTLLALGDTWQNGGNYLHGFFRGILIGVTSTGLYAASKSMVRTTEKNKK